METEILTKVGTCSASLKTESEIRFIQQDMRRAHWIPEILRWLDAVKDPTRFKIIYLLYSYKQLCVCDLANIIEVSSSAISQHLRKLKDMNLVESNRQKQTLFYLIKSRDFERFFSNLISLHTQT